MSFNLTKKFRIINQINMAKKFLYSGEKGIWKGGGGTKRFMEKCVSPFGFYLKFFSVILVKSERFGF